MLDCVVMVVQPLEYWRDVQLPPPVTQQRDQFQLIGMTVEQSISMALVAIQFRMFLCMCHVPPLLSFVRV